MPTSKIDAAAPSPRMILFCVAWSAYGLLHLLLTYYSWLQLSNPIELASGVVMTVATVLAILRPSSYRRFVALLLVWTFYLLYHMPYLANHLLFTLLVNLTILTAMAWRGLRPQKGVAFAEASFRDYAPLIRWELIAMYFWVVFHKLNVDFFNPDISCAWVLYQNIHDAIPIMPVFEGMPHLLIAGTLIIEALIPILLLLRPTRGLGLLIAIPFHVMLALHSNIYIMSFTSMLFATYVLFWPGVWVESTLSAWRSSSLSRLMAKRGLWVAMGVTAAFCCVVVALAVASDGVNRAALVSSLHHLMPTTRRAVCFAYFVVVLVWVCKLWLRHRAKGDVRLLRLPATPALLLLIATVLNGLMPYAGIRNQSSFAMFSNLRTSGGSTNHLFMPVSLRLSGFQDDVVVLGESNDPELNHIREHGYHITWFEFRRHLSKQSDGFTVTFTRDGQEHTLTLPENSDHEAFVSPPWWQAKLLLTIPVARPDHPCPCRH